MTALPSDVAAFTNDGVVLTVSNQSIKDRDPNSTDLADNEREMFVDSAADGQILLDELFGFVSFAGRIHEGIETDESLDLGLTIPVWPAAPGANVFDDTRNISQRTVIRAYSFDMGSDRFALELVGIPGNPRYPASFDSTIMTFDSTVITMDKTA